MATIFSSVWPENGRQIPKMPKEIDVSWVKDDFVRVVKATNYSLDPISRHLYRTTEKVYAFFVENFGVYGIDGRGGLPGFLLGWQDASSSWVFSGGEENNCFWFFSKADELSSEAVAHEYMHAFIKSVSPIVYAGQPGSLIEALSDVFAAAFKHWMANQSQQPSDWKIENMRDLSAHVDMRHLQLDREQNEHVHENSLILSHAFYKAVTDLKDTSYGAIAKIWLRALLKAGPRENFSNFAANTITQASFYDLTVQQAIKRGWVDVGILKFGALTTKYQSNPSSSL